MVAISKQEPFDVGKWATLAGTAAGSIWASIFAFIKWKENKDDKKRDDDLDLQRLSKEWILELKEENKNIRDQLMQQQVDFNEKINIEREARHELATQNIALKAEIEELRARLDNVSAN